MPRYDPAPEDGFLFFSSFNQLRVLENQTFLSLLTEEIVNADSQTRPAVRVPRSQPG
jgi:hypothetical protein